MSTITRNAKLAASVQKAGDTMTGLLQWSGTTHAGLKLLSLTTTQRDALTPAAGMTIYNSTTGKVNTYESGAWVAYQISSSQAYYVESATAPSQTPLASGSRALAIGNNANASGIQSIAVGAADASANYSLAIGIGEEVTDDTYATASAVNATAIGTGVTASGIGSLAAGYGGVASGDYSVAISGQATATYAFCAAHIGVGTASGYGSAALQGSDATDAYQFAIGGTKSQWVRESSYGVTAGYRTSSIWTLSIRTTDATPTKLSTRDIDATGNVVLLNNSTWAFRALIVGREDAAGVDSAAYELVGCIRRDATAASTAMIGGGTILTVMAETDATWDVTATADTTNGALAITVTGAAATNILWVCTLMAAVITEA